MTVDPTSGITLCWTAPELLEEGHASMASDVWAYGMTVLELFTRAAPFSDCQSSKGVMARIMSGKLPPRPAAEATSFRMEDAWWQICVSCWGADPSSRPSMKDVVERVKVAVSQAGPALTHPEASGSACPISKEGGSHPKATFEVAASATATGQASDSTALMKIASEYPVSIADTTNSLFGTEFFTCLDVHPLLVSDLNNQRSAPSVTVDKRDSVNLKRNNVEDNSLLMGSENTPRPAGLPPHFESQLSPANATSKDIFQRADMMEVNATEIEIALMEPTSSRESSFIGEGQGRTQGNVTVVNGNGADEETTEEELPRLEAASDSALSEAPAMKISLKHRVKRVWKRATSLMRE